MLKICFGPLGNGEHELTKLFCQLRLSASRIIFGNDLQSLGACAQLDQLGGCWTTKLMKLWFDSGSEKMFLKKIIM